MLLAGIALRNFPGSPLFCPQKWSMVLRKMAFIVILLRGGLSLDAKALAKMKGACLRLSLLPCSVEAVVVGLLSVLLLALPVPLGLSLGFVLAAVSPAVVVPSMLDAADKGYGKKKGIPTLVIAASSIDDVYAITLFTVFVSISFSTGESIAWTAAKVPLEIVAGVAMGTLSGLFLRHFPSPCVSERLLVRVTLLCALSCSLLFGCARSGVESAGPIAVLVTAFVAANGWKEGSGSEQRVLSLLWTFFFQPLLFVLIGFELTFSMLSVRLVAVGLVILCSGLAARTAAAYLAVSGTDLSRMERLFVAVAWLPKATVQAALAPVALDLALAAPVQSPADIASSTAVFAVAVLSILTTAPIGAFLIRILAPRLLTKEADSLEEGSTI